MKIIDTFVFYNELDMLNLRLHELNEIVDYFVLVEANKTYSNNEKEFIFEKNKNNYNKFLDKIIHIKIDNMPDNINNMPNNIKNWEREWYQRDSIKIGLNKLNLNDDDIILLSDVDEIFNINKLKELKQNGLDNIYNLQMELFYYNFFTKTNNSQQWPLARGGPYKFFKNYNNMSAIRKNTFNTLYDFGWHLSYFGNTDFIINKIKNFSHQEYNNSKYLNHNNINKLINNNLDILLRDNAYGGFIKVNINKIELPNYYSMIMFPKLSYLTHLGFKYNTDKAWSHLFTEFYYNYFKSLIYKKINILEIGIYLGSSLKMLEEFFPNATIYSIDIRDEYIDKKFGDRIKTYNCSQVNLSRFDLIFKDIKFDIIIDDGSHQTLHQLISLGHMFKYLNKNGLYICENLHTSLNKGYCNTNISTLDVFNNFKKINKINSDVIPIENINYLNNNIKLIDIYYKSINSLKCFKCGKINFDDVGICNCGAILDYKTNPSITSVIIHN